MDTYHKIFPHPSAFPPPLIFSSISPTFTMTEVPTPIFALSRFSSLLLFSIMPTGTLMVDLGVGAICDFGSDSIVCSQTVFFYYTKKQITTKNCPALRTNNYSLSESYRAILRDPHSLTDQLQSHLFEIKNGYTCTFIYI